jgi:hypothetical protein
MRVTQLGNLTVVGMSDQQEAFMLKRAAFVEQYCKEHGFTTETMSIQQILAMRQEEGWKNPK